MRTRLFRSELHSRGTVLKPGLISQANGSAYIETEKTKIAVAVCVIFPAVCVRAIELAV